MRFAPLLLTLLSFSKDAIVFSRESGNTKGRALKGRKVEIIASGVSKQVRDLPPIKHNRDLSKVGTDDSTESLGYRPYPLWDFVPGDKADNFKMDEDGAIDLGEGAFGIRDPLLSFEGLNQTDNRNVAGIETTPADPVGDVGPNHYVQMMNVAFAIWDKKGNILKQPTALGDLWRGFSVPDCAGNNGDPIVLYDQFEDRWLLTQFTITGPFYYNCFAISRTGDPLGDYNLYAFQSQDDPDVQGFGIFPDYPKYGVWRDSYILTTRDFGLGDYFGVSVYALEKSKMVAGDQNPGVVRFSQEQFDGPDGFKIGDGLSILPPDIDGDNLPPPGTPAPLVSEQDDLFSYNDFDGLNIWELMVDWSNVGDATLVVKESLEVASFAVDLCPTFTRECIDQPGGGQKLDAITTLTMYRFAYRNFGCLESMVVSSTVKARENKAGMRWYEIRRVDGEYTIHQQSTFSPDDGKNRWMGSVAQDGAGNIAMGYSVTDPEDEVTGYPGIQYTGRLLDDPLNKMSLGEAVLATGLAAQVELPRWGDYSSLNIDPVDDCTFWYTNNYIPLEQTNEENQDFPFWNSRIGSFTLPGCLKKKGKKSSPGRSSRAKTSRRRSSVRQRRSTRSGGGKGGRKGRNNPVCRSARGKGGKKGKRSKSRQVH